MKYKSKEWFKTQILTKSRILSGARYHIASVWHQCEEADILPYSYMRSRATRALLVQRQVDLLHYKANS